MTEHDYMAKDALIGQLIDAVTTAHKDMSAISGPSTVRIVNALGAAKRAGYPVEFKHDDCSQWAMTDGTCCPAGTHKRDCGVIISHNNQRNSHAPARPTMIEFIALATALSGVAYFILERILA